MLEFLGAQMIQEAIQFSSDFGTSKVWIWMDFVKSGKN